MNKIILFFAILLVFKYANSQSFTVYNTSNSGLPDNEVTSIYIDENDNKWFGTASGLVFYNGSDWTVYNSSSTYKIAHDKVNDIAFEKSTINPKLWIATGNGASEASFDNSGISLITNYSNENSDLGINEISAISVDGIRAKWFGGDSVLSSLLGESWSIISDNSFLKRNNISTIASTDNSINFVGTKGGGVWLTEHNEVDGITGGTIYEYPWSGILSNYINTIFVDDTTQWYGTEFGVSFHKGLKAKGFDYWTIYLEDSGLVNNNVLSVIKDNSNRMWFGTEAGLSVFDFNTWITITTDDGLSSNVIKDIAFESNGTAWLATDAGLTKIESFTSVPENIGKNNLSFKAYPNPAESFLHIQFSTEFNNYTYVDVYNGNGQLAACLMNSWLPAGQHSLTWNLSGSSGNKVIPGIYTIRIISGQEVQVKKIIVI